MKRTLCVLAIIAAVLIWAPAAFAFDLTVVAYNVESDSDTDPAIVAQDIQDIPQSHLWALVEVASSDFQTYRNAIGSNFTLIEGDTGGNDRLAIVFDNTVLEQQGQKAELSAAGGSRHPLLAKFKVIATSEEFWFVVNHLQRGREQTRQAQAAWLSEWAQRRAKTQTNPAIVLAGDFNFDVTPYTKHGNRAFDLFMQDGMFRWVVPGCVDTDTCPLTGSGCNPTFNSILDFVFLAGPARHWSATSEILFKDEVDYCPNERLGTSGQMIPGGADHRPVRAVLTF